MIVGFTGTTKGMTPIQSKLVEKFLSENQITEVHHGDCIGADSDFHDIANKLKIKIIIHPPDKDKARAFKQGNIILEPLPYLIRNHRIVESSDLLIATPKGKEQLRSGTWATVRYARKINKKIIIIYPI